EICIVGNLIVVPVTGQTRKNVAQVLIVTRRHEPSIGAAYAVVRHVLDAGLALRVFEQVPELSTDLHTALAHDARGDRRVVVGREVEVVRLRVFEAANTGETSRRREEAGLALVRERKLEPG